MVMANQRLRSLLEHARALTEGLQAEQDDARPSPQPAPFRGEATARVLLSTLDLFRDEQSLASAAQATRLFAEGRFDDLALVALARAVDRAIKGLVIDREARSLREALGSIESMTDSSQDMSAKEVADLRRRIIGSVTDGVKQLGGKG